MLTEMGAGDYLDRASVDRTALLHAEAVGGTIILQEIIDLEGKDLEARDVVL